MAHLSPLWPKLTNHINIRGRVWTLTGARQHRRLSTNSSRDILAGLHFPLRPSDMHLGTLESEDYSSHVPA